MQWLCPYCYHFFLLLSVCTKMSRGRGRADIVNAEMLCILTDRLESLTYLDTVSFFILNYVKCLSFGACLSNARLLHGQAEA